MNDFFQFFPSGSKFSLNQYLSTIILICVSLLVRSIFLSYIRKSKTLEIEYKRRVKVATNSTITFIIFLGLFFIWAGEIRTFAASFVAIAVAVVIALKELIMNMSGAFYRTTSNLFKIGDWVKIGDQRGQVIDKGLFSTSLLEIGPGESSNQYTGRRIHIPNSNLLSDSVINESFHKGFILHHIKICLPPWENIRQAQKQILRIAHEECDQWVEGAKRYMERVEATESVEIPTVEPTGRIFFESHKEVRLITRVTIPHKMRGEVEERIVSRFLDEFKFQSKG